MQVDPVKSQMKSVCVVGSFNADIVAYMSPSQATSEYNPGTHFEVSAGGKGFNVASTIASSGIPTYLVGRIGNDVFGGLMRRQLRKSPIIEDFVQVDSKSETGIGHVRVLSNGDYDTCVITGANGNLGQSDVDRAINSGIQFSHVILEFEVPFETAFYAAKKFKALGTITVVNMSPYIDRAVELLEFTDVLVVNEGEAGALWMALVGQDCEVSGALAPMVDDLRKLKSGPRDVVVTLGSKGVYAMGRDGVVKQLSAHEVSVTNAVGAGDSFLASLVSELAMGKSLSESITFANAAGAVACSKAGSWLTPMDFVRVKELAEDKNVVIGQRARKVR